MMVGAASLSQATQRFPPSSGMLGTVSVLRASMAVALPLQRRLPQRGVLTPRTGSPFTAEIAALGKRAEEPTATIGILCAWLSGAKVQIIATVSSASNSLVLLINLLLFSNLQSKN